MIGDLLQSPPVQVEVMPPDPDLTREQNEMLACEARRCALTPIAVAEEAMQAVTCPEEDVEPRPPRARPCAGGRQSQLDYKKSF